jgi:predicted RNA-binding protein with PIN domain
MPVLIDGNNLLYAAREIAGLGKTDRHELCRIVGRWAARVGEEVGVVFDGPTPPPVVVQRMRACGVGVTFSGGRTADDVIVEMIEAAPSAAGYTVVSSDHAIKHAARYDRAAPVSSQAFIRKIVHDDDDAPSGLPRPRPRASEKPEDPSPEETDEWLKEFGEE